jgi:predicted nucleic acid-binding protein
MIAADSSSLVCFLQGETGPDVEQVTTAISNSLLVLPPVVITEVLSGNSSLQDILARVSHLELMPGYWERAGAARRMLREKGLKARLGDALIAQSCIDHDVPLVSRDSDFRHFARHCGLKLAT